MHLGLIYQHMKQTEVDPRTEEEIGKESRGYLETWSLRDESAEKKALNYFLGAGSCMESVVSYLTNQINSVSSLDLEPEEKVLLTGRLKNKLVDFRISSSSNIETMISAASEDTAAGKGTYLNLMREILTRIRTAE